MVITWQQLRDAREYADLTQAELAEQLNVSVRTVVNWESENGEGVPRKSEYKVQRLLGTALRYVEYNQSQQSRPVPDEPTRAHQEAMNSAQQRSDIPDIRNNARERRRAAMKDFTNMDLLVELTERLEADGAEVSDWSASRVAPVRRIRDNVTRDLQTVPLDEEKHAADTASTTPDEDLRNP